VTLGHGISLARVFSQVSAPKSASLMRRAAQPALDTAPLRHALGGRPVTDTYCARHNHLPGGRRNHPRRLAKGSEPSRKSDTRNHI